MSDTIKQWERVNRALKRIENNRNRKMEEYEDDIWFFFQNCWHLKDWIKNDGAIDQQHQQSVEADVHDIDELVICADLANRSKHLKLTSKRVDADVTSRNTTIHAGPPGEGYGEYDFIITCNNNKEFDAIEIARASVEKWRELLTSYGVFNK